eukprot:11164357-Karenia_brevis.AAC.1
MEKSKSPELAETEDAIATASHASSELFDANAEVANASSMKDFNSPELVDIVSASATAGYASSELFDAMAEVANSSLMDFNSQTAADTVCTDAIAKAGHTSQELFDAGAEVAKESLKNFNPGALANTVWADAISFSAAISECEKRGQWEQALALLDRTRQTGMIAKVINLNEALPETGVERKAIETALIVSEFDQIVAGCDQLQCGNLGVREGSAVGAGSVQDEFNFERDQFQC